MTRCESWPTQEQTLLLQAALLEGDRAREAFAEWKTLAWTQKLDPGSRRLLPLLQRNLRSLGLREAGHERLVAATARAVSENEMLLDAVRAAVGALGDAGIECVLLKGMALALAYYPGLDARPMGDCDLLVRPADALHAAEALARLGWTPDSPFDASTIATLHAVSFKAPSGARIDLHWHVSPESREAGAQPQVPVAAGDDWACLEPIDIGGRGAWIQSPADLLLHVCVHGLRWSTTPPVRWAADAVMILRSGRRVDWDRLVQRAIHQRVLLAAREALRFLRDTLDAPVPEAVLQRLMQVRVSATERLEYRVKLQPRTVPRLFLIHWFQHRRASQGSLDALVRFPGYLRRLQRLRPRSR